MRRALPVLLVAGLAALGCEADRDVETDVEMVPPPTDVDLAPTETPATGTVVQPGVAPTPETLPPDTVIQSGSAP